MKNNGFTLLEMLVATTLIALLAGSLFASLRIAFKAKSSAASAIDPTRKLELTLNLLEQDLRSAAVPKGVLAGAFVGQSATDTAGNDSDSLAFYCTTGDWQPQQQAAGGEAGTQYGSPAWGDIRRIELSCEPSDVSGEQNLVRHETANLLAPQTGELRSEVLCRGMRAFNLRYFDGSNWQDVWDSTTVDNVLPLAVEMTIELNTQTPAQLGNGIPVRGYRMVRAVMIPCGAARSNDELKTNDER